jgi:formylglycine-generating enzyme required for sulfatase activity
MLAALWWLYACGPQREPPLVSNPMTHSEHDRIEPDRSSRAPHECPSGMMFISGGDATLGNVNRVVTDADHPFGGGLLTPRRHVYLKDFCMDRTEVTNQAYRTCLMNDGCEAPAAPPSAGVLLNYAQSSLVHLMIGTPGAECHGILSVQRDNEPVSCVSFAEATSYCHYVHKRLPTLNEWEYAARGTDQRPFPWGFGSIPTNALATGRVVTRRGAPVLEANAVESAPYDKSPFGILDLEGSVREWVDEPMLSPGPGDPGMSHVLRRDVASQSDSGGAFRAVCGQDWSAMDRVKSERVTTNPAFQPSPVALCSAHDVAARGEVLGFRCVSEIDDGKW